MVLLAIIAKAISTALVVALASRLAEFAGPFWGGLIASLPVSAGPAYVFLAMQHDSAFVAASALSSLAANAATALFLISYALIARRLPLWRALGVSLAAWLLASLVIRPIPWTSATAMALNLVVFGSGLLVLRNLAAAPAAASIPPARRWFDLPLRRRRLRSSSPPCSPPAPHSVRRRLAPRRYFLSA